MNLRRKRAAAASCSGKGHGNTCPARLSLPSEAHAQLKRSVVIEKFLEVILLKDISKHALDLLQVGMLITLWKGFQMAT